MTAIRDPGDSRVDENCLIVVNCGETQVSKTSTLQPEDLLTWQSHSFQLIAFPMDAASVFGQATDWFEQTVGIEPETTSRRYHRVDKGIIQNRIITLAIEPGKISWLEMSNPAPDEVPQAIPTLGQFLTTKDRFVEMMNQWIEKCPSIHRLAFAAKAIRPATSKQESYKFLDRYLHKLEVDPENSSEILYRINRRRLSKVLPNRYVNRLAVWSSLKMVAEQSLLSGDVKHKILHQESHACSVDLDINTDPESTGPIAKESLILLFTELVQLGIEILDKGDVE